MSSGREVILVAGARPNFMKVAPILRAFGTHAPSLTPVLVHTGQHYDAAMSDVFFRELEIRQPDHHLHVGPGAHGAQTAKILAAFEALVEARRGAVCGVVVVGDVNSTMACTLAAAKLQVPVAHVEAGLRSFDRTMPEEINRLVTDAIADLLITSEPAGAENLSREGADPARVVPCGNVMIDTLVQQRAAAEALDMPSRLGLTRGRYALVTLHRPSNVDSRERIEALGEFLREAAERVAVVFPMHPRTRAKMEAFGVDRALAQHPRVRLLDPLSYRENLGLMAAAQVALTDSGGIQEETSYLGVPCLTLRSNTERPVTVRLGTNTLVGDDLGRARALLGEVLDGRYKQGQPIPLWDGHAAERVVAALEKCWS